MCTRCAGREAGLRGVRLNAELWVGEDVRSLPEAFGARAGLELAEVADDFVRLAAACSVGGGEVGEGAANPGFDGASALGGGGEGLFAQEAFDGGLYFYVFAVGDVDDGGASVGADEELDGDLVALGGMAGRFVGCEAEGGDGGGAAVEQGRGVVVVGHAAVEVFQVFGQTEEASHGGTLGGGFGFEGFGGEGVDGGALFGEDVEGAVSSYVVAVEEVGQIGAEIAYHAAGEVAAVGEDVESDAEAVDDVAGVADGAALSAARSDLALGGRADVDAAAFDGLDDAVDECGVAALGCAGSGDDDAVDEGAFASDAADEVTDGEGSVGIEALGEARGVDAHFGLLLEEVAGGEGFAIGANGEALPRAYGALGCGVSEEVAGLRFAGRQLVGIAVFSLGVAAATGAEDEAEGEKQGEDARKLVHVLRF